MMDWLLSYCLEGCSWQKCVDMYWWLVKKIAWVPLYSRLMSLISWWVASLSSRCDHCWIESCTKRTRSGIRWWWCPWQTCSCICRRDVALHNTEWMSCLLATCMSIQLPVAQCWLYLLLMISSLWSVDVKIHPLQSYTSIYILLYPHSVSPWQVVHFTRFPCRLGAVWRTATLTPEFRAARMCKL